MGSHPVNLAVRFILELVGFAIMGVWGWKLGNGWSQYFFAILLPIIAASLWGVFAVPNDPSRSGAAPIITPGIIRLILELVFFAFATWLFFNLGYKWLSLVYGISVIVHYGISYDRIIWLLKH